MASFIINSPVEIFYDTEGTPLEDGYIYIGEAGKNPITNQINVFWDTDFNYPVSQPIRTLAGYPSRNGAPGNLYLNDLIYADYSITVQNKNNNNVLLLSEARSDFTLPHNPSTGYVNVKNFGATGDGTTDDYTAFSQALAYMNTNSLKMLYCPRGDYLLGTEILIDQDGITIFGDGIINTTAIAGPTKLIASHSSGAVIRIRANNCRVKDLYTGATTARSTGAAGYNFGIHAEGEDNATATVRGTIIDRVRISEQPSDGLVLVGDTTSSTVRDCNFDQNDGHGLSINRGESTGRTDNTFPPGNIIIDNLRCSGNGGHGMAIGDENATALPSYLVNIRQYEGSQNATDAGKRFENYDTYMNGDNNYIETSAFSGESLRGGIFMLGKCLKAISCRYVNCVQPVEVSFSPVSTTQTVLIDGLEVIGFAPTWAIICSSAAYQVRAINWKGASTYSGLLDQPLYSVSHADNLINYNATSLELGDNYGVEAGYFIASKQVRSYDFYVDDDDYHTIDKGSPFQGLMLLNCGSPSRPAGMLIMRVYGSSDYINPISVLFFADMNYTTGPVTGTTGPDGKLTLSAVASGQLAFENRLGSAVGITVLFAS